jgi:hypothetical protein
MVASESNVKFLLQVKYSLIKLEEYKDIYLKIITPFVPRRMSFYKI